MIAGLELPTSGKILLDGEDVTFRRAAERDIAFVFQLFALIPAHERAERTSPFRLSARARRVPRLENASRKQPGCCASDHLLNRSVSGLAGVTASVWRSAARSSAGRRSF